MKMIKLFFITTFLTIIFSCNSYQTANKQVVSIDSLQTITNKVGYDRTENLNFSIADTVKRTASYFFSNQQSKDVFLLTIEPGLLKNSKS